MNEINYSIIIPHKNSASLLQYCLDSIPIRDDVQVIVVDDNSDPGKVDFDHFPKWKGNNYESFFTKDGKGAGYARNVGLEHAVGKWLTFIDADDFLGEDADRIFEENKDADADIVFLRLRSVMQHDRNVVSYRLTYYVRMLESYFDSHEDWQLRVGSFIPVSKFISRSLVDEFNIRFDETRYANDCYFSTCSGINARKIIVRNDVFYVVTESDNSLTSSFCSKPGELECRADVFFRVSALANKSNYPIDKKQAYFFLRLLINSNKNLFIKYSRQLVEMGVSKKELIRECFKANKISSRLKRSVYACFVI